MANQKKIVVLGGNGMLGYAMVSYYQSKNYNVTTIDRKQFDALLDSVEKLIPLIQSADYIVNCIGIIKPRISAMKPEEVLMVNGTFPKNLAKLAKKEGIPLFHITTDCVYSGADGNYDENSYFDINDLYGLSKNAGENSDCMTIRTSIIGEEVSNKYSLLEWAISQKGKEVSGYDNHVWNGVTTLYLAQLIDRIHDDKLYVHGITHLHSPNKLTKYELLMVINEVYSLNMTINRTSADVKVDRSLSSVNKLSAQIAIKELSTQIKEMHDFFKR